MRSTRCTRPASCSTTTPPASPSRASDEVREHIAGIFRNWPGMRFTGRSLYVREGLVVQEWTATGTHAESGRSATWDGMDILPTHDGRFTRKDVYSDSVSVMRQLGRPQPGTVPNHSPSTRS